MGNFFWLVSKMFGFLFFYIGVSRVGEFSRVLGIEFKRGFGCVLSCIILGRESDFWEF